MKNLIKLYNNAPPVVRWKLNLLKFLFLDPIEEKFGEDSITITSGWRSTQQQEMLATNPRYSDRVTKKKVSQHELSEAVDFVANDISLLPAMYKWCHAHLRWWQLIIYFEHGHPSSLHISLMSEDSNILRKALYYLDGVCYHYDGSFSGGSIA